MRRLVRVLVCATSRTCWCLIWQLFLSFFDWLSRIEKCFGEEQKSFAINVCHQILFAFWRLQRTQRLLVRLTASYEQGRRTLLLNTFSISKVFGALFRSLFDYLVDGQNWDLLFKLFVVYIIICRCQARNVTDRVRRYILEIILWNTVSLACHFSLHKILTLIFACLILLADRWNVGLERTLSQAFSHVHKLANFHHILSMIEILFVPTVCLQNLDKRRTTVEIFWFNIFFFLLFMTTLQRWFYLFKVRLNRLYLTDLINFGHFGLLSSG